MDQSAPRQDDVGEFGSELLREASSEPAGIEARQVAATITPPFSARAARKQAVLRLMRRPARRAQKAACQLRVAPKLTEDPAFRRQRARPAYRFTASELLTKPSNLPKMAFLLATPTVISRTSPPAKYRSVGMACTR
jgi:hypothetical protein